MTYMPHYASAVKRNPFNADSYPHAEKGYGGKTRCRLLA